MAIRDASGMQPKDFAAQMVVVAKRLGLESSYSDTKLSKLVNGRQDVSLDDAIVLAHLDPEHRGVEWIALGEAGKAHRRKERDDQEYSPRSRRRA